MRTTCPRPLPTLATIWRVLLTAFSATVLDPRCTATLGADRDEQPGQGVLIGSTDGAVSMPLERTEVRVDVSGFVASVDVVQVFGNPFDEPIEARYVFPLPERAAVDGFVMEVGPRRIRGEIRRREEARKTYEAARGRGYTAALMEQERPNIFTQSVANIAPGARVRVHLHYVEVLAYAEGAYRFLFPMVVAPRYVRGQAPAPSATAPEHVSQPRFLKPGQRSGHDIRLSVRIQAGVPIRSLTSVSHGIQVTRDGASEAVVELTPADRIPNKDLMLKIGVAGEMPEVGVLAHRLDDDGFFALLVQPKAAIEPAEAAPKEILFVLDDSGSMSGAPIEMSKRFMRRALESLAVSDRFNIVRFAGEARVMAPEPLANTVDHVARGLAAVEEMRGDGGSEMILGFRAALAQSRDPACVRIVIFLTDGQIGHEQQIFDLIRRQRGDARIFTLGIGSSVNHYLLREMAELGRGAYEYVRPDGREREAVDRFRRWVTRPYLTDLTIDWGGLRVEDVQPSELPDLFSGQTLSLVGRYLWGGDDTITLRGRLGGVPWEKQVTVSLPERSEDHAALASVWARERIHALTHRPDGALATLLEAEVTSLALAFSLMSPFTSFVAVDESVVVNPAGDPARADQVVPIPDLMSFEGCFGEEGPIGGHPMPVERLPEPGPQAPPEKLESATAPPAPGMGVLVRGTVTNASGQGVPGVPLVLFDRQRTRIKRSLTDVDGHYRISAVPPGRDYFIRIDAPGYEAMELGPLDLQARRATVVDPVLRSDAEMSETITVESMGSIVDTTSTATSTSYYAEFVEAAPIIGRNYQDIQVLGPGVVDTEADGDGRLHGARGAGPAHRNDGGNITEPVWGTFGRNLGADIGEEIEVLVAGASDEYGRAHGGFVVGDMPPPALAWSPAPSAAILAARAGVEEAALRILADLAEDGRLSRSEGLPALAGLMSSQLRGGWFGPSVRTQALALWALARATVADPRLPWVRQAALAAADSLRQMGLAGVGWPELAAGPMEPIATRMARLALDLAGNCDAGLPDTTAAPDADSALLPEALFVLRGVGPEGGWSAAAAALARRIGRAPLGLAPLIGTPGACLDREQSPVTMILP